MQNRHFLIAAFVLTILAVALFSSNFTALELNSNTSSATALHTNGHQIVNANGDIVYFRGIGRGGDIDSMSGFWSGRGMSVYDNSQAWQTDKQTLTKRMDETLACYRDTWKANLVRIFVPVDWWWLDKINPYLTYGQGPNLEMSYQNYIILLVEQAQKYGLYVDFCPYEVRNYFVNNNTWDGIPGSLGDLSISFMHTINSDEMKAWQIWWTNVAYRLSNYPNVIFELWNEPDDGTITTTSPIAQAYFNYSIQAYIAIRAAGATNLVFMQWHAGFSPSGADLSWVPELYNQLKNYTKMDPLNIVFTAHPYRRGPYPNLDWATTYTGVKSQLNEPNMIPITRSNGIDVPLVFNEMGVMSDPSVYDNDFFPEAQQPESNLSFILKLYKELDFWDAILRNAKAMGIGVCAYYWMQSNVWWGWEALAEGEWGANALSPTPSSAGQKFIDAYLA